MDAFLGEIRLFGWGWVPRNWAQCNGALLSIAQNTALFSVIGTAYGGDGRTSFGLPNLKGTVAVGAGQGPGLQSWMLGQTKGADTVTLTAQQLPAHAHTMYGRPTPIGQTLDTPSADTMLGRLGTSPNMARLGYYAAETPTAETKMAAQMLGNSNGGGQPHENRQPFLAMYYCICVNGIYPPPS